MAVVIDAPWAGQTFNPPTALDIATLEGAIVSQLQAQISGVEIAHFPDRPEAYRLTHRTGAVLVVYRGAEYGPLFDTAAIVQARKLKFEVRVLMRDLGWAYGGDPSGGRPGAYEILEAVRAALTGYRIPGCRKLYPLNERFVERDVQGGVWIYAITFALETVAVEPSTPDNFPLFVKGLALEEGGNTLVVVGAALFTFDSTGAIHLPAGNVSAVTVSSPGGTVFAAGVDYALDTVNGVITVLAGGTLSAGQSVNVAYSYADIVTTIAGMTAPTN